ncbi:hypothetical protein ACFSKL_19585 [Belliella marina]|uniref:Uncharacterized protein n=1 Tax=Belliella marina TaxID=1644146 RepID=A0ABW4VTL4_9BACT
MEGTKYIKIVETFKLGGNDLIYKVFSGDIQYSTLEFRLDRSLLSYGNGKIEGNSKVEIGQKIRIFATVYKPIGLSDKVRLTVELNTKSNSIIYDYPENLPQYDTVKFDITIILN